MSNNANNSIKTHTFPKRVISREKGLKRVITQKKVLYNTNEGIRILFSKISFNSQKAQLLIYTNITLGQKRVTVCMYPEHFHDKYRGMTANYM